jgi:hypothetical protein
MRTRGRVPFKIVAAASCGILAGAIAMAVVLWAVPTGMHLPSRRHAGGHEVFESRPSPLASPPPVARPPILPSTAAPAIEANPLVELRDRQLNPTAHTLAGFFLTGHRQGFLRRSQPHRTAL